MDRSAHQCAARRMRRSNRDPDSWHPSRPIPGTWESGYRGFPSQKSWTLGFASKIKPVEVNGVAREHGFLVSGCVALNKGRCDAQPFLIGRAQSHHRPIAAPHDPIRAKTGKYVGDESIQLCGTGAQRRLSKQSGQLAIDGCISSESVDLTCPGVEGSAGDIRFAGMIEHGFERRISTEAPFEYLEMARGYERVECQVILENCLKGRIERGAIQPKRIINVLDHRPQSLEFAATFLNQTTNSIGDVTGFKVHPTNNARYRGMTTSEFKQETGFRLGGRSLNQDRGAYLVVFQLIREIIRQKVSVQLCLARGEPGVVTPP